MNFSTRYGFAEKKSLQLTSMDDDLRHSLWNKLDELFNEIYNFHNKYLDCTSNTLKYALKIFWCDFFKQSIYLIEQVTYLNQRVEMIRNKYYNLSWYEIYSFLEFIARFLNNIRNKEKLKFVEACNYVLERENSAYRFVGDLVAPITSEIEIKSIEKNLMGEDEAAKHINSALTMLANKQNDQSRESVAQSMLAVEAIAKKITGDKNATLSSLCQRLKILPNHPQARQALFNLYNYTSSKEGIRHALTDESQPVTREWARFMLVTSSAFVNLIKLDMGSSL